MGSTFLIGTIDSVRRLLDRGGHEQASGARYSRSTRDCQWLTYYGCVDRHLACLVGGCVFISLDYTTAELFVQVTPVTRTL